MESQGLFEDFHFLFATPTFEKVHTYDYKFHEKWDKLKKGDVDFTKAEERSSHIVLKPHSKVELENLQEEYPSIPDVGLMGFLRQKEKDELVFESLLKELISCHNERCEYIFYFPPSTHLELDKLSAEEYVEILTFIKKSLKEYPSIAGSESDRIDVLINSTCTMASVPSFPLDVKSILETIRMYFGLLCGQVYMHDRALESLALNSLPTDPNSVESYRLKALMGYQLREYVMPVDLYASPTFASKKKEDKLAMKGEGTHFFFVPKCLANAIIKRQGSVIRYKIDHNLSQKEYKILALCMDDKLREMPYFIHHAKETGYVCTTRHTIAQCQFDISCMCSPLDVEERDLRECLSPEDLFKRWARKNRPDCVDDYASLPTSLSLASQCQGVWHNSMVWKRKYNSIERLYSTTTPPLNKRKKGTIDEVIRRDKQTNKGKYCSNDGCFNAIIVTPDAPLKMQCERCLEIVRQSKSKHKKIKM